MQAMTYRDDRPTCPSCRIDLVAVGTRLGCEQCKGVFVRAKEVDELLRQMSSDVGRTIEQLLTPGGSDVPRPCPRCETAMIVGVLDGVTIDRCVEHGIWFDATELSRVVANEEARVEPRRRTSSGLWRDLGSVWKTPRPPQS